MFDLIVTPLSPDSLPFYKEANSFLVGTSKYCVRYCYDFNLDQIKMMIKQAHELKKKIYINVNKIFHENEIKDLKAFLSEYHALGADAFFFSDFCVLNIGRSLNILNKLIYYSETQVVNSCDAKMLLDLGIKGVIASKEAMIDSLKFIASENYCKVGMLAHGYMHMFYSKRKLLSTYCNKFHHDDSLLSNHYKVTIKEDTRDEIYPIYQDQNGVNIFTDHIFMSLEYVHYLKDLGMYYFIIDGIFLDMQYQLKTLSQYNLALNDKSYDLDYIKQYPDLKHDYGFLFRDTSYKREEE